MVIWLSKAFKDKKKQNGKKGKILVSCCDVVML